MHPTREGGHKQTGYLSCSAPPMPMPHLPTVCLKEPARSILLCTKIARWSEDICIEFNGENEESRQRHLSCTEHHTLYTADQDDKRCRCHHGLFFTPLLDAMDSPNRENRWKKKGEAEQTHIIPPPSGRSKRIGFIPSPWQLPPAPLST